MSKESDRELLVLAAKAAGMMDELDLVDGLLLYKHSDSAYRSVWDPLEDDGEALRLALVIPACIVIDNDMQWCGVHLNGERGKYEFVEEFNVDKGAATRRAIVRAAAEIGRQLKG